MPDPHGSLTWSIKESLLTYLRDMPDAVVAGSRASDAADAPFVFAEAPDSTPERPRYLGNIRIRAHDGLMNVDISDPAVVPEKGGWVLVFRTATGAELRFARLADLDENESEGLLTRRSSDVALLIDATPLFGGNYAPYTRLAAVVFSATAARRTNAD
jgi:hypothetical protein